MPAGSWAPTPLSISKEGEREKHLEQETRGIEEKMWVGDRALGGGLDTHRSQVERQEMGGRSPPGRGSAHPHRHFWLQRVIRNREEPRTGNDQVPKSHQGQGSHV